MDDIGDTSLGITSLPALAWQRGKDPRLPEAVHRSLAFHLRERVHTEDNPGQPNLKVRDSGLPYARYVLAAAAHPIGDSPSTVWALLQAVNILDLADGLVDDEQTTTTGRSPSPSSPRPTRSAGSRSSPRTGTRSPAISTHV